MDFELKNLCVEELNRKSRKKIQKNTLDFHSLKNCEVEVGPRLKEKLNC